MAKAWGRANLRAGDAVVLTELEHHANIVPWHQLRRGARHRAALDPRGRRRPPRPHRPRPPRRRRPDRVVRGDVQRARHDAPGRAARAGRARRGRHRRGRRQPARAPPPHRRRAPGAPTSSPSPATRCCGPTGIGVLWGTEADPRRHPAVPHRRRDDPQRHQGGLHAQRAAVEVRGRHAAHRRGRRARRGRSTTSTGLGMDADPRARGGAHGLRAAHAARPLRRRPHGPRPVRAGRARRRAVVLLQGPPPPRPHPGVRPARRVRAGRAPLRQGPDAPSSASPPRPAPRSTCTTTKPTSTPWRDAVADAAAFFAV